MNKINGVPIAIFLSKAFNCSEFYRLYSRALFWFRRCDLALVWASETKSFALSENFWASIVTPFLIGGAWAWMVWSISYKSGQSSIELVSRESKSISDCNWTYWSRVPSKCYSKLAVVGSAIMYFSTCSCVLNKFICIFFLKRFLTISLNDILSSILFIRFALD